MLDAYYFGCWGRSGHFLWTPDADTRDQDRRLLPWPKIDGVLCPGPRHRRSGEVANEDESQGSAAIHYRDGWTALAFWDRSVDSRHGSNSVFLFRGTLSADEILSAARKAFPAIFARFTFEITIREVRHA